MRMRVQTVASWVLAVAVGTGLAGCAQQPYRSGYGGYGPGYGPQVCADCGVVQHVEQVYVERNDSTLGTILGAVIGGALGNQIGHGRGNTAATIAGAVAGGAVGNAVSKQNGNQVPAWRIWMRMSDGRDVSLIQRQYPNVRPGDAVVIHDGRVYPRWRGEH
ncbi:glycine zipper 2TM domain-containing protein [Metallibacterium sp.]|uniref:glycine zipper 2TM domain-containing protein n=1 Tax=Metallibacterium sp. TaxID=2940281 RepID=UPI0031BA3FDA